MNIYKDKEKNGININRKNAIGGLMGITIPFISIKNFILRLAIIGLFIPAIALNASAATITLDWDANSEIDLAGYRLYQATSSLMDPVVLSTTQAAGLSYISKLDQETTTSYTITELADATSYYFRLTAFDETGNESLFNIDAASLLDIEVSTFIPPAPDTIAPSMPIGLEMIALSSYSLNISFEASTDNIGVAGYRLDVSLSNIFDSFMEGFNNKALPNSTSADISGLEAGIVYYARLRAIDAAGNISDNSTTVSAATLPAFDTTAPSIPTGLNIISLSSYSLNISWTASTDNVGVTGYRLDISLSNTFDSFVEGYNDKELDDSVKAVIMGLADRTVYYARLRAIDAAENISANSDIVFCSTLKKNSRPPKIRLLSDLSQVNIASQDIAVIAEVIADIDGDYPVDETSIKTVISKPGSEEMTFDYSMIKSTHIADAYELVLPDTFTALCVGEINFVVQAKDELGSEAVTETNNIQINSIVNDAPDTAGKVVLPHKMDIGGFTSADFSLLPVNLRPAIVNIEQKSPIAVPMAVEPEIDNTVNGGRAAVAYNLTADGNSSTVFGAPVKIVLAYADLNNDGIVDDTGIEASRLRVFYYDINKWRLVGGSVDLNNHTVSVDTNHFSVYALFAINSQAANIVANIESKEKFLTPAKADGINDVATFGTDTREVEIYDLKGKRIFSAASSSVIVWNGKDESGKIVESGAYIAKMKDAQGKRYYQTIIVAK